METVSIHCPVFMLTHWAAKLDASPDIIMTAWSRTHGFLQQTITDDVRVELARELYMEEGIYKQR